jgi:hypothetical protein
MARGQKWINAALVVYNCMALSANTYVKFIDPNYDSAGHIDFRVEIIGASLINLALLAALIFSHWRQSRANT